MRWRLAVVLAAAACASCGLYRPSVDDLRNDPHGHLVWAARHGDVAAIRRLAANGVDLDAAPVTPLRFVFPDVDHAQWTALQHAAGKHQVEAVRVLLEWGADPDANGATALLIAAGSEDPTMMRLLLDAGADVNRTMATEAWKEVNEGGDGNPLGHLIAHVLGLVSRSPKDVQQRIRAIAAQSRP
jgi:ankyrin repeat protein